MLRFKKIIITNKSSLLASDCSKYNEVQYANAIHVCSWHMGRTVKCSLEHFFFERKTVDLGNIKLVDIT